LLFLVAEQKLLQSNKTPKDRAEILKTPGQLSAQIVMNSIIDNDYKVWVIVNVRNGVFFHVNISEESLATVAFTSKALALGYSNRKLSSRVIYKNFGKKFALMETTLMFLYDQMNATNKAFMGNMIFNPNTADFYIPIPLSYVGEMIDKKLVDYNPIEHDNYELTPVEWNTDTKSYVVVDEDEVLD